MFPMPSAELRSQVGTRVRHKLAKLDKRRRLCLLAGSTISLASCPKQTTAFFAEETKVWDFVLWTAFLGAAPLGLALIRSGSERVARTAVGFARERLSGRAHRLTPGYASHGFKPLSSSF